MTENSINETGARVVVELWYAPLPRPLKAIAWHHHFVVRYPDRCDRYEVWQRANAGGESVGHVHRNLKGATHGCGGGPAFCLARWEGDTAERLASILAETFERYPYQNCYRYFPGPNSNTYVAWVLREAGIPYTFNWRAIGSTFR